VTRPGPAQRRRRSVTATEHSRFLEALAAGWSVTHAAEPTGHSRQRFYELRDADEDFAAAWSEAVEAGTQRLEDEAMRRAVEGYDEVTFDAEGGLVRRVRRYDSALLQLLLKGRRPAVYRESAGVEVSTPAVFVLESAFGSDVIEAEAMEVLGELPAGEDGS
jgi:hypothetical protein